MANSSKSALQDVCTRYLAYVHGRCSDSLFRSLGTYIGAIPRYTQYKLIVVVERPYFTDIYPDAFSAMSYDPELSAPTPATLGAAKLIASFTDTPEYQIEEWFRDSWMFIDKGVLMLNVCCTYKYIDAQSIGEKLEFQRILKGIVLHGVSSEKHSCTIVSMGNPAKASVLQVLSSLGSARGRVSHKTMPNPAVLSHRSSDSTSRRITAEYKGTLRYLANFINQFELSIEYPERVDRGCELFNMSDPSTQLSKSAAELSAEFNKVALWVGGQDKLEPHTVMDALSSISRGLESFAREVTKADINLKIFNAKKPNKGAQPSSWGFRPDFKRGQTTLGTASQISTSTRAPSVSLGGFADEEEDTTPSTPTRPSAVPQFPGMPSGGLNTPGSFNTPGSRASQKSGFADDDSDSQSVSETYTVDPAVSSYLRVASVFVEDLNIDGSLKYATALANAAAGKPTSKGIMVVASIIKRMIGTDHESVAEVLGMSTGTVDESSELVKVLKVMEY